MHFFGGDYEKSEKHIDACFSIYWVSFSGVRKSDGKGKGYEIESQCCVHYASRFGKRGKTGRYRKYRIKSGAITGGRSADLLI